MEECKLQCDGCCKEPVAEVNRLLLQNDVMRKALAAIEDLNHDDQCGSDQGSRYGDCMDDHRCYCAQRVASRARLSMEAK